MPISVIVGGQFGSEGKGKVALHVAREQRARAVVRVGGSNSGHTAADAHGKLWALRQLPASSLAENSLIVLPAGSLIDPDILMAEASQLRLTPDRLVIDAMASVITGEHKLAEASRNLDRRIGSTCSGTGAALVDRIARERPVVLARDVDALRPFVRPFAAEMLRQFLTRGERVVIEGTQGFGLSLWHSPYYPFATSRDTTAGGFVSEAGLAPHDVDDVVLVLRAMPIRVGGNSGELPREVTWPEVCREAGLPAEFHEVTTVTKRPRRIARFDPEIVKMAVTVNNPHRIVVNHLDYIDPGARKGAPTARSRDFINGISLSIGRRIDWVGYGPRELYKWSEPSLLALAR